MNLLTRIVLQSFFIMAAVQPVLADVIVTDDAVVVQGRRASSENERDDRRDENLPAEAPGVTVVSPDGDVTTPEGEIIKQEDLRDSRRDKIILVPDRN